MPTKKMKTNQDGGSVTAKNPGAAAKELKKNEDSAAKMGYKQEFGAARMSPSKRGDKVASELMHGAGRYYDGAGQYMNGAPKYEGAAKHHGAPDMHKGPMDMHKGPMDMHKGPMDAGHGGAKGHTHSQVNLGNVNVDGKSSMSDEKQNLLELIGAQNQYDRVRTTQVLPKLGEIDSLKLVAKGKKDLAKDLYGEKFDASKATRLPYSITKEKRKELYDQAKNIMGERPSLD